MIESKKKSKGNNFKILLLMSLLASSLTLITSNQSRAAECKPVKPRGQSVGSIKYGSRSMPIIPFTYPAGGVMEPQKTTKAAAISLRHMPLDSKLGTSVIAWHVDFNGCVNELNALLKKPVGHKFSITDDKGAKRNYVISEKFTVKKGNYKRSWFSLVGPRQLAMFTCSGPFEKGHYRNNEVLIAVPALDA